jgi:DNA-binding FadR family transcriptional regulator
MILEDRDVERNWNLLIDLTERWPGGVSKPSFIQFLTKGFISQERPRGFTVTTTTDDAIRKLETQWKTDKENVSDTLDNTLNTRLAAMDTQIETVISSISDTVTNTIKTQMESMENKISRMATAGASETTLVIPCPSLSQANP